MKKLYLTIVIGIVLLSNSFPQPEGEPDTIFVSSGWNLIGSKYTGAVSDIIITEPPGIITSPFYKFIPGGNLLLSGYAIADSLEESFGYWVKLGAAGMIIVTPVRPPFICGHLRYGRFWYGGKLYRSVLIGSQCWLKPNLDIGTMIDRSENQTDNGIIEKYCYGNSESNCDAYGGLYQWDEVMQYETIPGTKGICPLGWKIPTAADFLILKTTVGGDGNSLKAIGEGSGAGAGTDLTHFSALLAGYHIYGVPGDFFGKNSYTRFWSSSQSSASEANFLQLNGFDSIIDIPVDEKADAYSIRCLRIDR